MLTGVVQVEHLLEVALAGPASVASMRSGRGQDRG